MLQQALRDLSQWVEKGIAPASSTNNKIVDGQVVVPLSAAERHGIQPVVTLTVGGAERAGIKVGQSVTFTAEVEVPEHTGKIVSAAWDFDGSGDFLVAGTFKAKDQTGSRATLKMTHTFKKQGTFFPTLRVASQREGDAKTPYTRIQTWPGCVW